MDLLQVEVEISNREHRMRLFEFLREWQFDTGHVLAYRKGKEGVLVAEIYVTREQMEEVEKAQIPVRVVLDLSKVPDPRTYVSRENRFAEELERIRSERKGAV